MTAPSTIQWQRYRLHALGASALVLAVGVWLIVTRWTPDEAANAQHFQQARLEVRAAIAYANERGGMISPSDTEFLIGRYAVAADHGDKVTNSVLGKLHPDLTDVWHDVFLPSTKLYLRALQDQDRDLARHAGRLQDDWVRWVQLHGHQLDIPDPPAR